MSIDMLLALLRLRRDILVSEREIWWSSHGPDRTMLRALRRHRKGLAVLIAWSDRWVCPTPAHQAYYYYRNGRFICGKCEELLPWVS